MRSGGDVVVPDLIAAFAAEVEPLPSCLGPARLAATRAERVRVPLPLPQVAEEMLWRLHAGDWLGGEHEVSRLDLKLELARRLWGAGCRLCGHGCAVDRSRGELGRCGLGAAARFSAPFLVWGEEAELGRPGLALSTVGCGLRCVFCYRPEHLLGGRGNSVGAAPLTAAPAAGSVRPEHLHFLGGNPDESLPAILELLAAWEDPPPVVWNTHAYLTPAGTRLLEGVVDAVVADLKFGPGACAGRLAGAGDYWAVATRTLAELGRMDLRLVVRHVAVPGHMDCCARPAAAWAREHLPRARVRVLDQYEPWGRAWHLPGMDRRLDAAERAVVAELGDDPPTKGL